jgi:hypothetical protein
MTNNSTEISCKYKTYFNTESKYYLVRSIYKNQKLFILITKNKTNNIIEHFFWLIATDTMMYKTKINSLSQHLKYE